MAARWIKSLQCKSTAFQDVHHPLPKQTLLTATSCRNTYLNLKDVVDNNTKPKPKPRPKKPDRVIPKPEPGPFFPSVTELHEGHPSRNVVEIIFHTRWGPTGFSGRIEVVFKIQNLPKTVARFEEYRDWVRSRADPGTGAGRCVADGNEMMRFHCLGPTATIDGGKASPSTSICTYSGSGAAHESAGGGRGRRAMVVCRVIAGRVSKRVGPDSGKSEFDSVTGESGELLVFDSRAILPCFLVIYNL